MEMIKLLLRYGADITVQNDSDETALDVASPRIKKVLLGMLKLGEEEGLASDGRRKGIVCSKFDISFSRVHLP